MFLYWFNHGNTYRIIRVFFQVSLGIVGNTRRAVQDSLCKKFVPLHLGFGALHKLNMDRIKEDFSSWLCKEISEKLFKCWLVAVIDGTYIFCMSFGGMLGQKLLYSTHKKRRLSKVRF